MSGPATHVEEKIDDSFDDWNVDATSYATEALTARPRLPLSEPAPRANLVSTSPQRYESLKPIRAVQPAPIPCQDKTGHYPALISRSALFPVARLDGIHMNCDAEVKSQGAYKLTLCGPSLTMLDKSVWEAVVDLAKEASLDMNENLQTSLSEIARRVGWQSTGSRVLGAVWESLQRLAQAKVAFQLTKGLTGSGFMLAAAVKDSEGVSIRLDAEFVGPILRDDYQFRIDSKQRGSLESTLAQWLHDFLSTHEKGKPLTLGYLRELCGYTAQKRRFPKSLESAMSQLASHVPDLVSAYKLLCSGKNSDLWLMEVERGTNMPSFVSPSKTRSPSRPARRNTKRSGVAL